MSVLNLYPTVRPTLSFDFVNAGVLDPSVTFTRTTSATYFDETGILRVANPNTPRFDYNPSTLAAQGLLIEESRTNLLLQSADFTTTWSQTNVTITANTTASPDGGTNGDTLLINSAGANTTQTSQSFTAGSTITVSVFAKKNASNFLRIEVGNLCSCWFDLNTGVTGTNGAGSGNVLFSAKSIQAISNGWYRCALTVTTSTITTLSVGLFATNTDNNSSSVSSSIFLWGAQCEVGAFPTSYIPTTTTALTRSADVASVNTLSPWFNSASGTLYAEGVTNRPYAAATGGQMAQISDGTANNRMWVAQGNTTANTATNSVVTTAGVLVAELQYGPTPSANYLNKAAFAYAANDFAGCTGGGTVATDPSGAVPTATVLYLGISATLSSASTWNGYLRRITYYPVRLTNAQLQNLTA
jgi:hypothetical protein